MTRPACVCTVDRHCRPCVLIATRPDYAVMWGVAAADVAAIRSRVAGKPAVAQAGPLAAFHARRLPCVHLGDKVVGQPCGSPLKQCRLHADITSRLTACSGADRCCASCPDYAAVGAMTVVVPEPPALVLSPRRPRAVVTVAAGDIGRELFAVSGPHMAAYAERVDADLVVLDWVGNPAWPIIAKFAVGRVLDWYDRIVFVDADVFLRSTAVNLFEQCAADEFGAVDELVTRHPNAQKEYLDLRRDFGYQPGTPQWYLNTGVMVASKSHQQFLLPPSHAMPTHHCAEQDVTTARVYDAWIAGTVKVRLLFEKCNWQWWRDTDFARAPADAVLHWSGSHVRNKRVAQIREWAIRFPVP